MVQNQREDTYPETESAVETARFGFTIRRGLSIFKDCFVRLPVCFHAVPPELYTIAENVRSRYSRGCRPRACRSEMELV